MTSDPAYGLRYFQALLARAGLAIDWCYLAEDAATYGISRERLAQSCREADVYFNLSNINWIPELEACRRRILIDTDPVFTQIGAHGLGGPFSRYDARFTYGENVHKPGCSMPTGHTHWRPTRQPVVLELWPVSPPNSAGPLTTVMNWSAYGAHDFEGRTFGQKDREFEAYFELPREVRTPMQVAANAPEPVRARLKAGGWTLIDPLAVTRSTERYQQYLADSRGEFSVAKHAYVTTRSGWFSDRSCGYLASGRPAIVQDTGFSQFLPCGRGLLTFRTPDEARAAIAALDEDFDGHCRAARELVAEHFDYRRVLGALLEASGPPAAPRKTDG